MSKSLSELFRDLDATVVKMNEAFDNYRDSLSRNEPECGVCHNESSESSDTFRCSECRSQGQIKFKTWWTLSAARALKQPYYCPICGAKVVSRKNDEQ